MELELDITSRLSADVARRMWQDYLTLFSGVLAERRRTSDPGNSLLAQFAERRL